MTSYKSKKGSCICEGRNPECYLCMGTGNKSNFQRKKIVVAVKKTADPYLKDKTLLKKCELNITNLKLHLNEISSTSTSIECVDQIHNSLIAIENLITTIEHPSVFKRELSKLLGDLITTRIFIHNIFITVKRLPSENSKLFNAYIKLTSPELAMKLKEPNDIIVQFKKKKKSKKRK